MIQSVVRALEILEVVGHAEDGTRLSEVADRLQIQRTTAHNLMRTLRDRGYLEQVRGGRYHLGAAASALGDLRRRQGLLRRAEAELRRLLQVVPDGILTLSELVGTEIWCRLRLASAGTEPIVQYPTAQTFSAFGSASGLCLQAFHAEYRQRLLDLHGLEESGERFWNTREAFEKDIHKTLRNGVACIVRRPGIRLAAPVGDAHVLGLNLPEWNAKTMDRVTGELRESAKAIQGG